jgi:hypothetical protein
VRLGDRDGLRGMEIYEAAMLGPRLLAASHGVEKQRLVSYAGRAGWFNEGIYSKKRLNNSKSERLG